LIAATQPNRSATMLVRDMLQKINFGSSVAEHDQGLQSYFVATGTFQQLIKGNVNVIAGDKGTGKTSIYRRLKQSYGHIPELKGVEILTGFNPSGEPMFKRLNSEAKQNDDQYKTVWKMYFLSLIGNWFLDKYSSDRADSTSHLASILEQSQLKNTKAKPVTIFTRLMVWLRKNATPKSVGIDMTINEQGFPVITPKIELGNGNPIENAQPKIIDLHHAFSILNEACAEKELAVWVLMDRLDEAFVDRPEIETLALRALVSTYRDLEEFKALKIILFVRNDLFRKITRGGFRNLDHVSGRKKEIIWDGNDLLAMLCERLRQNQKLMNELGLSQASNAQIYAAVFLGSAHPDERESATWEWMLAQVRDGNNVMAPRNVIDLCLRALEIQQRKETYAPREYTPEIPLIEMDALQKAAHQLSVLRLEDTLLAEYGEEIKQAISEFDHGAAEHTKKTLAELFNQLERRKLNSLIESLCAIGFLEQVGNEYHIPPIYRKGLNITQGKAGG
jgi:hypothetical protein